MALEDVLGFGRKKKREYISKADKQRVLERQKGKCAKCSAPLWKTRKVLDHKKARALKGSDKVSNLQYLCPTCNAKKTPRDMKKIAKAKRKKREDPFGFGESFTQPKRGRKKKDDLFGGDIFGSAPKKKGRKKKPKSIFDL